MLMGKVFSISSNKTLTRVQDVRQDGDDTQLTVAARLLHHVLVDDLDGEP